MLYFRPYRRRASSDCHIMPCRHADVDVCSREQIYFRCYSLLIILSLFLQAPTASTTLHNLLSTASVSPSSLIARSAMANPVAPVASVNILFCVISTVAAATRLQRTYSKTKTFQFHDGTGMAWSYAYTWQSSLTARSHARSCAAMRPHGSKSPDRWYVSSPHISRAPSICLLPTETRFGVGANYDETKLGELKTFYNVRRLLAAQSDLY